MWNGNVYWTTWKEFSWLWMKSSMEGKKMKQFCYFLHIVSTTSSAGGAVVTDLLSLFFLLWFCDEWNSMFTWSLTVLEFDWPPPVVVRVILESDPQQVLQKVNYRVRKLPHCPWLLLWSTCVVVAFSPLLPASLYPLPPFSLLLPLSQLLIGSAHVRASLWLCPVRLHHW